MGPTKVEPGLELRCMNHGAALRVFADPVAPRSVDWTIQAHTLFLL